MRTCGSCGMDVPDVSRCCAYCGTNMHLTNPTQPTAAELLLCMGYELVRMLGEKFYFLHSDARTSLLMAYIDQRVVEIEHRCRL